MTTFLLFVPLAEEHAALAESVTRTAIAFLETAGTVETTALGEFARDGRKDASGERLRLVQLTTSNAIGNDATRARALEGVLRSTLTAAGVRAGDVRVFVGAEGAPCRPPH